MVGSGTRARLVTWSARVGQLAPRGDSLPNDVRAQRHRAILTVLWLHVPAIFLFALHQQQGLAHAVAESSIVAAVATAAVLLRAKPSLSTSAVAVGVMSASAVLVHLADGQIEMHFHYFVMVGVVTLYQDWRPFLIAIGYVVFHHGVVGVLSPESVYSHQQAIDAPWRWAGVHGVFILAMSIAGLASWRFNEVLLRSATDKQAKLAEAQRVARLGSWEWIVGSDDLRCSDELLRLFDLAVERAGGGVVSPRRLEDVFAAIHHDDARPLIRAMDRLLADGRPFALDVRVDLAGGAERCIHTRGKVAEWRDGAPTVVAGTAQDVTERKRAEVELRDALSLLGATLDATADGILVVDAGGRITSHNQRFVEMWAIPDEILERGDAAAVEHVMSQVREPELFSAKVGELYGRTEAESLDVIEFLDGRVVERCSKPQRVGGETVGRVWSFRDVTDRHRLERELAHQAFHDSLTGLANPVLFRDRIDHALARVGPQAGSVAVLFIDLDNFKTVNDSLGHTVGDGLLVAVANRLREALRPQDTAARHGGDEFAVLVEDVGDGGTGAVVVADALLAALRRPVSLAGREVVVSASIGIAFSSAGVETDQLLRNADLAMYTAKRLGKDRVEVFEASMHRAAVERLEIENDLRRALDGGELSVHYQPIVTLHDGAITGVEALVRWDHPQRGRLSPATFIPLAEETGLISELGWQVLDRACADVRAWQRRHGRGLSLSVNLSPRQLQDDRLLDRVAGALAASGLDGQSLVLEITEGAMMQDTDAAIAKLHALRGLGVKLAVDDFGTGYSSLSYLQRFPIDVLKIDRSFVSSIHVDAESSSIARMIVSLANTLKLHTVAEGIETLAQRDVLVALGCELAQGYYFAKPMDADALDRLLGADAAVGLGPAA